MNLTEKLKSIDKPSLQPLKEGSNKTIKDFWDTFIDPLLPKKEIVISFYEMLIKYVEEPNAVFAIRTFNNWADSSHDNKSLRRGFYTKTNSNYSFFYTDNFFAAYFCKMAMDGYVPDYDEFKQAMISREFPARFGRHDSKFEKVKAAYSIDGKKGRDPLFTKNGYKIAHIINAGKDFLIDGKTMTIQQICEIYYPRGKYEDWIIDNDEYGKLYVRYLDNINSKGKEILKAHFLRFACPLNYILTPGPRHHETKIKVYGNDIAESPELQQYAMEQFKIIYGKLYDEYLSKLMISSLPHIDNPGDVVIGIDYGYNIRKPQKTKSLNIQSSSKTLATPKIKVDGVGQYCKNIFFRLLEEDKLNQEQILNLRNKDYCHSVFSIAYPIVVDINNDSFEKRRYYKDIVKGKYYVCSQWLSRHKEKVDSWLNANGLTEK